MEFLLLKRSEFGCVFFFWGGGGVKKNMDLAFLGANPKNGS